MLTYLFLIIVLAIVLFMVWPSPIDAVAFEPEPIPELTGPYEANTCLLYTSPSPRDRTRSRMPSSA